MKSLYICNNPVISIDVAYESFLSCIFTHLFTTYLSFILVAAVALLIMSTCIHQI